jgi:hypothetical protein
LIFFVIGFSTPYSVILDPVNIAERGATTGSWSAQELQAESQTSEARGTTSREPELLAHQATVKQKAKLALPINGHAGRYLPGG